MRLIVYSCFVHTSYCAKLANLNFSFLLLHLKSCLKTRKIFVQLAISMQRMHTDLSEPVRRKGCVVPCDTCDSLQTSTLVPRDVQITLGIPVQMSPWHSLRVFVTQWSGLDMTSENKLFYLFFFLVRLWIFDCGCNICFDHSEWKVEEGRKWAKFGYLQLGYICQMNDSM